MIKSVYTCVTGNYDNIYKPTVYNYDWSYYCFTNHPNLISKKKYEYYNIIPINDNTIDPVRLARYYKILGHSFLDSDLTIWHDANMQINCDLNRFYNDNFKENDDLSLSIHPERNCIYEESEACIKLKKDDPTKIMNQIKDYELFNMPKNYGLYATGILIRKNTNKTIGFYKNWFNQVTKYSRRDQISFPYCLFINKGNSPKISTFTMDIILSNFIKHKHNPNNFGGKY